jgi:hypothetical protein
VSLRNIEAVASLTPLAQERLMEVIQAGLDTGFSTCRNKLNHSSQKIVIRETNGRHAIDLRCLHKVCRRDQSFLKGEGGVGGEMDVHPIDCKRFQFSLAVINLQQIFKVIEQIIRGGLVEVFIWEPDISLNRLISYKTPDVKLADFFSVPT